MGPNLTVADAAAAPPDPCPNCGAALAAEPLPRYCWHCGQATLLVEPPLRVSAREVLGRYGRTIAALLGHPGRLTREYIANRRGRYVAPLRLYLTASFLFFLIVKVLGVASSLHIVVAPMVDSRGNTITAASNPVEYEAEIAKMHACIDHPGSCSWAQTLASRIGLQGDAQASHPQAVAQRMIGMAPNAVFVLLPVFAALLMLAYRSRKLGYGTHLVFSLHMHSFWFLALLALWLLPGVVAPIGTCVLAAHSLWALHRVYGGRWRATLGRSALVALAYVAVLFATVVGLSIASVVLT
jgi:hypothetical protein